MTTTKGDSARTLYERGWRQGTVFRCSLTVTSHLADSSGSRAIDERFETWVVVSQDCDLSAQYQDSNDPSVEIRPTVDRNSGPWGIRSRILRITQDLALDAGSPRLLVSPALLVTTENQRVDPDPQRRQALKTWLGKRYDRPAVPEALVALARCIGEAITRSDSLGLSDHTHDILMQFQQETDRTSYALIAVITSEQYASDVEHWLTEAALEVPTSLGVLAHEVRALTKAETSLELLEDSFSADLSQITWKNATGPQGAP